MVSYFQPLALAALRLFTALLAWQHASRRLFGMFGGDPAPIFSFEWIHGNVELVASVALAIGFLTRPAALVIAVDMLLVYLVYGLPRGFPPLGGNLGEQYIELALVSALLAVAGPGRFSIDADIEANHPNLRVPFTGRGLERHIPHALGAVRIAMGVLFANHGLPKIGIVGDRAADVLSQAWVSGVIETFGGSALALGLFTRPVAFVTSGMAAFAYFLSHAPRAFAPIQNSGDRAATYCFFFLLLVAWGPGRWALDGLRKKGG
jgi:putative oxidoreductase